MTKDDFFSKVEWEGGIIALLQHGINVEEIEADAYFKDTLEAVIATYMELELRVEYLERLKDVSI